MAWGRFPKSSSLSQSYTRINYKERRGRFEDYAHHYGALMISDISHPTFQPPPQSLFRWVLRKSNLLSLNRRNQYCFTAFVGGKRKETGTSLLIKCLGLRFWWSYLGWGGRKCPTPVFGLLLINLFWFAWLAHQGTIQLFYTLIIDRRVSFNLHNCEWEPAIHERRTAPPTATVRGLDNHSSVLLFPDNHPHSIEADCLVHCTLPAGTLCRLVARGYWVSVS